MDPILFFALASLALNFFLIIRCALLANAVRVARRKAAANRKKVRRTSNKKQATNVRRLTDTRNTRYR
jgi:hypothetical protein